MAKGQSVSLDLMFGVFISIMLFTYLIIVMSELSDRYIGNGTMSSIELAAISMSNMLVESGGFPFNWTGNVSEAKSIGFAQRPGVLDIAKIKALESAGYAQAKKALNVDYDFMLRVEEVDGYGYAAIGMESNSTQVVEVSRAAVLNGKHVFVKVRVYG